LIYVSIGLAMLLFVRAILFRQDPRLAARLAWVGSGRSRTVAPSVSLLGRLGRTRLAKRLGWGPELGRRWELAGRPASLEAWQGIRVAGGLVGLIFGLLLGALTPSALALAPIACGVGIRVPEMILSRKARVRQGAIGAHIPDLVEALVATTAAGLSPMMAFQRSSEVIGGPLGHELVRTARQVDLGLPWRAGLEQLAHRTDVPSIHRLVVALSRSHRLGTPLASTLRTVAHELREERRVRAEELARRAPVRMLFPLVFLILPAFLLLTVGPVVLATIRSLH